MATPDIHSAARVRAVRDEMPTFFGQMALSAATAAVCLLAVVYMHERSTTLERTEIRAPADGLKPRARPRGASGP